MLTAELMRDRITSLECANETATKRRSRKKKRIQRKGALTKGEGEDMLAQKEADQQIEREKRQGGERSGARLWRAVTCRSVWRSARRNARNTRTCSPTSLN
jgi:hypothetical protein